MEARLFDAHCHGEAITVTLASGTAKVYMPESSLAVLEWRR
jgi:hypothetical protein